MSDVMRTELEKFISTVNTQLNREGFFSDMTSEEHGLDDVKEDDVVIGYDGEYEMGEPNMSIYDDLDKGLYKISEHLSKYGYTQNEEDFDGSGSGLVYGCVVFSK